MTQENLLRQQDEFERYIVPQPKIEKPKIERLKKKYSDCFSETLDCIGSYKNGKMKITVTSNKPVNRQPYRVSFANRKIITNIVEELLANGIIKPSDSPYASPIVLVKKQNGEDRMCIDYRELNSISQKEPFPMPVIEEMLAVLSGNKYFGLTLRPKKCVFLAERIKFLGHNVSADGIGWGDEKVAAIKNFLIPTDIHGVRRFLGLTGFFRKFVNNYAAIAKPLTQLLKTINSPSFKWKKEENIAYESLKTIQPVLCLYDPNKNHEVHTYVLMQEEDGKKFKPVFYYSRRCSEQERQYNSYELEVLAIVESLERLMFLRTCTEDNRKWDELVKSFQ